MKRNLIRLSVLCLLAVGLFAFASPSLQAQAATARKVTAYCSWAAVSGKAEQPARYVRITVAPASNLTQTIARVYARIWPGRNYSKVFSYSARQPDGTRLAFAVCESNGANCLRPAKMLEVSCKSEGATPTPTAIPTAEPTLPPTTEPTLSPTPEPTLPPTPEPTLSPTPTPIADVTQVTCSWASVTGTVTTPAPYVRFTISQSNPIQEIGSVVVPVQPDGSYNAVVTYPLQPEGARLLGAYGEWDGTWWLQPATMFGADCQSEVPPGPLVIHSVQFWPDGSLLDRYGTVDFGARINLDSSIVTRVRLLAFFTYQGEDVPGALTCMSQHMPGRGNERFWSTGTSTELAPGANNFEQMYRYDRAAPDDATHLVMWLMLTDANDQSITCQQKVLELSPATP